MDAEAAGPSRDLQAARRAQILDAATRVFAEKGFERATVRDIARAAGIADGSLYNYFANKSALLLALLDRLNETDRRAAQLTEGAGEDPGAFLRAYLARRFATLDAAGPDLLRALLSELLVDADLRDRYHREVLAPTFAAGEAALRERMARGAARPGDPALAARVLAGAALGLLLLRLLGDPPLRERWDEIPDVLAALLLDGLLASTEGRDHDAAQRA